MTRNATPTQHPWLDRWNQPNLEQLLDALKAHHRKPYTQILEQLDSYPGVQRSVIWYGSAWKWTIHYAFVDADGQEIETLCYIVPNSETPLICIPLADEVIEQLPIKRLTKFIREGIRSAKFAVAIHWATWSPLNQTETHALIDLCKRKHKFISANLKQDTALAAK
ncbi:MAG: hypothetical protein GC164_05855 [Phycisphaera sp.]|nr:hypothetical protein [Phycisphaera sp.]